MYYRLKLGPEVKPWLVMVVFGRQRLFWNNWTVDEVEWTTPKYGHQN